MEIKKVSGIVFFMVLSGISFSLSGSLSGSLYNDVFAEEAPVADAGKGITYIVKKGDTLWDVSGEYLRNPFLWPAIHEKNEYIKNPDLIYPGNILIIPGAISAGGGTAEQTLDNAEVSGAADEAVEAMEATAPTPVPPLPDEPDIPESIRTGNVRPSSLPVSYVHVKAPVRQTPAPVIEGESVFTGGYVADKISSAGVITRSLEDRNVFASGDSVTIKFNSRSETAAFGDRYTIFRKSEPLIHPHSGKEIGSRFIPIGILEIYRVQGRDAGGRIIKSYDYISSGDQIQSFQPASPVKEVSYSAHEIKGYIIGSREGTELNAQNNVVYLDRGSKDGISPGTMFKVTGDTPNNILGELLVISVQGSTSTALVTSSIEPFGAGNQVITSEKNK